MLLAECVSKIKTHTKQYDTTVQLKLIQT